MGAFAAAGAAPPPAGFPAPDVRTPSPPLEKHAVSRREQTAIRKTIHVCLLKVD